MTEYSINYIEFMYETGAIINKINNLENIKNCLEHILNYCNPSIVIIEKINELLKQVESILFNLKLILDKIKGRYVFHKNLFMEMWLKTFKTDFLNIIYPMKYLSYIEDVFNMIAINIEFVLNDDNEDLFSDILDAFNNLMFIISGSTGSSDSGSGKRTNCLSNISSCVEDIESFFYNNDIEDFKEVEEKRKIMKYK